MPLEPEFNGYLKIYNFKNPNFLLAPINNLVTRGGQINRLPINRLITDINRTDITVTDSYQLVIG